MESGVEQSLEGHQGGIFCLAQGGAYLFSGGEDMCIYTWQYAETGFAPRAEVQTELGKVAKAEPDAVVCWVRTVG